MTLKRIVKRGMSLATFLAILSLVAAGFDFAVEKSIGKDNNVAIASRILKERERSIIAYEARGERDVLGIASDIKLLSANKCDEKVDLNLKKFTSVYKLMMQMGMDPSFENREVLAAGLKIENYTGTIEQNKKLIDYLVFRDACPEQNI